MGFRIYDSFAFLHGVKDVPGANSLTSRSLPISGVVYLLRNVANELLAGHKVAITADCQFGTSENRKLEGYKSNRKKQPSILVQAVLLEKICKDCGIPFYKGFGEADDHIYGLCQSIQASAEYSDDPEIIIYSNDGDIWHNINYNGVSVKAATAASINVNSNNFYSVVMDKYTATKIVIGTISAFKVFRYDTSDVIHCFKPSGLVDKNLLEQVVNSYCKKYNNSVDEVLSLIETTHRDLDTLSRSISGIELYNLFVVFLDAINQLQPEIASSKETITTFVDSFLITSTDVEELHKRIDVIYPKYLGDKFPLGYQTAGLKAVAGKPFINAQMLVDYFSALGVDDLYYLARSIANNYYATIHNKEYLETNTTVLQTIWELSNSYTKGKFHADNSLPTKEIHTTTEHINVFNGFD